MKKHQKKHQERFLPDDSRKSLRGGDPRSRLLWRRHGFHAAREEQGVSGAAKCGNVEGSLCELSRVRTPHIG